MEIKITINSTTSIHEEKFYALDELGKKIYLQLMKDSIIEQAKTLLDKKDEPEFKYLINQSDLTLNIEI